MNNYQHFKQLHEQDAPLYIGNVWDIQSALMFEKMGYKALGTSSAAVAESLGYEDGEQMSFDELLTVVKSITKKISLPLTVDLEAGYSRDINQIIENISLLSNAGVVGINLEDSVVENGNRDIVTAQGFSQTIQAIKAGLSERNIDMFLNIRTDFYIMGLDNPLEETVLRAKLYEKSGADGIFVPCIVDESDIQQVVNSVSIPVNVMTMPQLPSFAVLQKLGVKRISMGPFIYNNLNESFKALLEIIEQQQSFAPIFK